MKRVILSGLLTTFTLLGVQGLGLAQTPQTPEQRNSERSTYRNELMQKIEQNKYDRMKSKLALDDETAKKFFEVYKPAEKDVQEIVRQRNEELKNLGLMMNGAKSDADVDPEMQKIRDLNQKIESREQQLDADLKPLLSPRQRARLLMLEHEFYKQLGQASRNPGAKGPKPELRNLRRQLRQERLKNMLLRRQAGKLQGQKR